MIYPSINHLIAFLFFYFYFYLFLCHYKILKEIKDKLVIYLYIASKYFLAIKKPNIKCQFFLIKKKIIYPKGYILYLYCYPII